MKESMSKGDKNLKACGRDKSIPQIHGVVVMVVNS